jgi:hypothetical protein
MKLSATPGQRRGHAQPPGATPQRRSSSRCGPCGFPQKEVLCALLALAALSVADGGAFYCESTSKLVSKRVGTYTRSHKTWMTKRRMRFDDGEELITIFRLDMGELWIASRETKTFLRKPVDHLAPGIVHIDDGMSRILGKGVTRFASTKSISGRTCTKHRMLLGRTPCLLWVDKSSEGAFDTARRLARDALIAMSGRRYFSSPAALPFGALRGLPLEISVGDPKTVELTWTITKHSQPEIPKEVFSLPSGYQESNRAPPQIYTLPEHVYYLGEATASYFAPPSSESRQRSLLPVDFVLKDAALVRGFYEGKADVERSGYIRWSRPLCFYLAPDLWHFPVSARAFNVLLVVGRSYLLGGLKYFPYLGILKRPAG